MLKTWLAELGLTESASMPHCLLPIFDFEGQGTGGHGVHAEAATSSLNTDAALQNLRE